VSQRIAAGQTRGFEKVADAAYYGLVGHRLAAEIDPDKPRIARES
jgi:hypothetical protein